MSHGDLVLLADLVITLDEPAVVRSGAVAMVGGRIAAVGPATDVIARFGHVDRLDLGAAALLPGFVDVHTHPAQSLLRGLYGDGQPAKAFLPLLVTEFLKPEDTYALGVAGCLEALAAGTTTMHISMNNMAALAQAVVDTGLRADLAEEISDYSYAEAACGRYVEVPGQGEQLLAQAVEFADGWSGAAEGRVSASFAPLAPDFVRPDTYRAVVAEAERRGAVLTTHLAQSRSELQRIAEEHGLSPVAYLDSLGALGQRTLAAHCWFASDADLVLLRERRSVVAHCPRGYLYEGSTAPLADWLRAGTRIALGTDDLLHSMWETMRAAVMASAVRSDGLDPVNAAEVLRLATLGGAEALGLGAEIGSLSVGKRADLMVVDLHSPTLSPMIDPVRALVLHGGPGAVRTVFVGGRAVAGTTVEALVEPAAAARAAQRHAASVWARVAHTHPEIVPPAAIG